MENSSQPSVGRSQFKDITNTSIDNATSNVPLGTKPPSRPGRYARMSDEKKKEYLEKRHIGRQQKKAAAVSDNSGKPRSSSQGWYAGRLMRRRRNT